MSLTNKAYDTLKWIAQYLLPAAGTLYFALAKIWGIPYGTESVGTISAIDAFLGALLGISSHNYEGDGTVYFDPADQDSVIELNNENIPENGRIVLQVKKR